MTAQEFHSDYTQLMEHYQMIEMHLEGIYGWLHDDGFLAGLASVERDSIRKIIHAIRVQENRLGIQVLSDTEYDALNFLCKRRNFWVHECFVCCAFQKDGALKNPSHIKQMKQDIRDADTMRNLLYEKVLALWQYPTA